MIDMHRNPDEPQGDATDIERIIPQEQPPMDDAAGPRAADDSDPESPSTRDLTVQGGE